MTTKIDRRLLIEVIAQGRLDRELEDMRLKSTLGWDEDWLGRECIGDGFDPNPLLAGPGGFGLHGSASMSGEIVEGRGDHSHATFRWEDRR